MRAFREGLALGVTNKSGQYHARWESPKKNTCLMFLEVYHNTTYYVPAREIIFHQQRCNFLLLLPPLLLPQKYWGLQRKGWCRSRESLYNYRLSISTHRHTFQKHHSTVNNNKTILLNGSDTLHWVRFIYTIIRIIEARQCHFIGMQDIKFLPKKKIK